jgi:hypothetical protein
MNIVLKAQEIARIAGQLAAICEDDERLFSDMMEGETDLHKLITRLHEGIANDAGMVTGIKERKADLDARQKRLEARIDAQKGAIVMLMQAGQQSKVELPEVTYSLRDGKPKLVVVDDDAVPDEYCTLIRKPVKATINEAFADADALPNWLTLEPAKPILTGRKT